MPSDPLNLEPKNGDFVDYIESLQASSQKNLDGITPPMTADHHIGLPPNAAGRADDGISLKDLIAAFRRKNRHAQGFAAGFEPRSRLGADGVVGQPQCS
mgnify:FL=1